MTFGLTQKQQTQGNLVWQRLKLSGQMLPRPDYKQIMDD
jgi:hypothetical protein